MDGSYCDYTSEIDKDDGVKQQKNTDVLKILSYENGN